MKKNRIFSMFGLTATVVTPLPLIGLTSCGKSASTDEIDKSRFEIKDGVLTSFNTKDLDISQYTTLAIPSGVRSIGKNVFRNKFANNPEVTGKECKITKLVLPSGLRRVEAGAFAGCTAITELDLTAFNDDDASFITFGSNSLEASTNNLPVFDEWAAKGTVKTKDNLNASSTSRIKNILLGAGLQKYWFNDEEAPKQSEAHILNINDFHGAAPGFGDDFFATNQLNAGAVRLTQETQEIIYKHPGSVLLSGGDFNAGESFSTCAKAETFYPVVHEMGFKYSAVGNHAWEWGKENLENEHWDNVARQTDTKGKFFITANVLDSKEFRGRAWAMPNQPDFDADYATWNAHRVKWADPYKVINMNGHDVCLIGLTTDDTMTDGNLNAIENTTFMQKSAYSPAIAYAKELAKQELKDDFNKIESFILLTHCECQPSAANPKEIDSNSETYMLANESEVDFDAILAAHSHRMIAAPVTNAHTGKKIWIGQAGQSGRYFLDTKLEFDDSKPVGQRLKNISMEVKQPEISGQNIDDAKLADKKAGAEQVNKIIENTLFPRVKSTAKVYEEQKELAKKELNVTVGKINNKGLPYYYTENTARSFGTQYMQSPYLVEPATIFAQRGQIFEFNKEYKTQIAGSEMLPASIALNNLDSFKNGFNLKDGETEREVIKNEIFSQNAFENSIYYGCLTIDQIKQFINYTLEGAGRFDYATKVAYGTKQDEQKMYYDSTIGTPKEIEWTDKEEVGVPGQPGAVTKGVSYACGCIQFYGMSFKVEVKDADRKDGNDTFTVYKLAADDQLKFYDASNASNIFEDPSTWTPATSWTTNENHGYVPVICSSFTWQGGNAQNRMLHHWFDWNTQQAKANYGDDFAKKIACRMFSLLTRDAIIRYAQDLTKVGQALDYGIDENVLKKLVIFPND